MRNSKFLNFAGTENTPLYTRGFILALLICALSILELLLHGESTPLVFSDWDEPFYLVEARETFHLFQESWYDVTKMPLLYPHMAVDIFVGSLLSLTPGHNNLWLIFFDIVSITIAFALSAQMLIRAGATRAAAQFGSLVAVLFPWCAYPRSVIHLPVPELFHIISPEFSTWPNLPLLRAFHTQLSWIPLLFCLRELFILIRLPESSPRAAARCGFFAGLCLYFYFYAWCVAGALCPLLIVLASPLLFPDRESLLSARRMRELGVYSLAFILVSGPGLYLLTFSSLGDSEKILPELPRVWFFSPENILFCCLCLFALRKTTGNTFLRVSLCFLIVIILAEFALFNIQPILQRLLFPYHFTIFYLAPIFAAFAFSSLWEVLPRAFNSPNLLRIARSIFFAAPIFFTCWQIWDKFAHFYLLPEVVAAQSESRSALREIPLNVKPGQRILFSALPGNSIVDWLVALSGIEAPIPSHNIRLTREERNRSIRFMDLIFDIQSNDPATVCVSTNEISDEHYFVSGLTPYLPVSDYSQKICHDPGVSFEPCDYLHHLQIDYVLWTDQFWDPSSTSTRTHLPKPSWFGKELEFVWQSPGKHYQLYRWTSEMEAMLCQRSAVAMLGTKSRA